MARPMAPDRLAPAGPLPPAAGAASDAVLLAALRRGEEAAFAEGEATVVGLAAGGRVLTLTDFEVDDGPDLRVCLVAGSPDTQDEVVDDVDLGALKGDKGDQRSRIGRDVDVGHPSTAVIWCRAVSVLSAHAPLER